MAAPVLPNPRPQFADANGAPYSGGTITTYVKGTTTYKQTWADPDQAALNTQPVTLDASGRAALYGDGDYRLQLHDASGNLIWDAPSSTTVSAAMYPVVSAPSLLDARNAMGITALVNQEAADRNAQIVAVNASLTAAVNAEATIRLDSDNAIEAVIVEAVGSLDATDHSLQSQISALSGTPVITAVGGQGNMHFGIGTTSASLALIFPTPFATACQAVTVTPADLTFNAVPWSNVVYVASALTTTGCTITGVGISGATSAAFDTVFNWVATGH